MKVSIHQPQYIPWLPYFLKIAESDRFIFLDTVDFQKNGLQNRNQIKTGQGAHWLTVPVQQRLGQKIGETAIQNTIDWRRKHFLTLQQSYGKAAAFAEYASALEALYAREWNNLAELDIAVTLQMMAWLGIDTPTVRSSAMAATGTASDLVLALCREAGATEYISGAGGKDYLKLEDFERAGIAVTFRGMPAMDPYPQPFPKAGFVANLSALDIILNCGDGWRSYGPGQN